MRKVLARLGTAALLLVCSLASADTGTALKPYVTLILDTSGSMVGSSSGNPTGFGATSCGTSDTKLNHAKCAIYKVANSYGDIVFSLSRFRTVMGGSTTAATFPTGCCEAGPAIVANGTCAAGVSCANDGNSDSSVQLLTGLVDGNNSASSVFVNGTGNSCTTAGTDPEIWDAEGLCSNGGNGTCGGGTPLGGVLKSIKRYWSGQQASNGTVLWDSLTAGFDPIRSDPTKNVFIAKAGETACNPNPGTCDPATSCTGANCCCVSQCRPYITILLTDGDESCAGDPVTAATALLATDVDSKRYRITTKAIGFGVVAPTTTIENIAHAGGAADVPLVNEGYYAQNEAQLQLAISDIIAKSVRSETCNGRDDDCDTFVDEDFPTKNDACTNGEKGVCLVDGTNACRTDGTGVWCDAGRAQCAALADGSPCAVINSANATVNGKCNAGVCDPFLIQGTQPEICNNLDDDCDGKVDEGLTGCVCTPQAETCNAADENCDHHADQTCTCSNVPHATCSVNADCGGANTCNCVPLVRNCGTGTCLGTQTCGDTNGDGTFDTANGMWGACNAPAACTGTGPDCGICDGRDNDCDGVCDGFSIGCSTILTPDGPATDNPGDPSHGPIPENVCHPGEKTCPQSCAGTNSFGACLGEEQGCNPSQSGAVHCDQCDGLDNDCDNRIDEDFVPTACSSNCGVGMTVCMAGHITCNAQTGTVDNTCDHIDDDCDGVFDEDWVCDSSPTCTGPNCCRCGSGTTCEQTVCINGVPT